MESEGTARRRRPFCNRCSKPARVCICDRFKSPPLDNSIAVTILQHSLEKTHSLNSSRVARLGLKNLRMITVTDVIFRAQFLIRPLEPKQDHASSQMSGFCSGVPGLEENLNLSQTISNVSNDNDQIGDIAIDDEVASCFSNHTVTYSSEYIIVTMKRTAKPDIGWTLDYPVGKAAVSNGFTVRKLQRKRVSQRSKEFNDFEEFNLVIPQGSVLLFPSSNAIDLAEVDHEVKHLIVLDGTWAKARRMYNENPWLKLLPHLKLNQRKESLYGDMRHEPKVGYLSTVESIVCALKGLGNDMKGLDEILELFESMIMDQRRCKDERIKAMGTGD